MNTDFSPFEGPEKKLEIILRRPWPGLRAGTRDHWDRVAAASRARILNGIRSPEMDAYLLSESSLFVWDGRVLMITCGQTTLVEALPEILTLVPKDEVDFVFYERKNLMYPLDQPADFEADVKRLETWFPGKSYRLGPANRDHVHVFYSSHEKARPGEDATLEILMHRLPESVTDCFTSEAQTASAAMERSGLATLFHGTDVDAHLFSPCGLSVNAVRSGRYSTVHVTPQPRGSYVSYETNILAKDYRELVAKVLDVFRPGAFTLVLTASLPGQTPRPALAGDFPGYRTIERGFYEFDCGYHITHAAYSR
jgi:S-adenosylmethionine decarboxylase